MSELRLGRLRLPAVFSPSDELGDGLEAVGAVLVAAERRPRPLELTLSLRGEPSDTDAKAVGERLRRQLTALLENPRARLEGMWLDFDADPFLESYVLVGGGKIAVDDYSLVLGEYALELTDLYRVGKPATHRAARRIDVRDLRTSTAWRDYKRTRYSTDFANFPAASGAPVAIGALISDSATGGVFTKLRGSRTGRDGNQILLARAVPAAAPDPSSGILAGGSVVSYEQEPGGRDAGDVLIHDTRGSDPAYTPPAGWINELPNPRAVAAVRTGVSGILGWGGLELASVTDADFGTAAEHNTGATAANAIPAYVGVAGDGTGTNALLCTPGERINLRASAKVVSDAPASVDSLAVEARFFDGAGAVLTDVAATAVAGQDPAVVNAPVVGAVCNLAGYVIVPAGAQWVALRVRTGRAAVNGTVVLRMSRAMLLKGATLRPYFDGDTGPDALNPDGYQWGGVRNRSRSYLAEPEPEARGWEEAYGPAHEFANPAMPPVLSNGLCRIVWKWENAAQCYAVEQWEPAGGGGWAERGRVVPFVGQAPTLPDFVASSNVVEWTPDRAVIRVVLTRSAGGRAELYVTLVRGWTAPHFELYTTGQFWATLRYVDGSPVGTTLAAFHTGTVVPARGAARITDEPTLPFESVAADGTPTAPAGDPYAYMQRAENLGPGTTLVVPDGSATMTWRSENLAYIGNRRALEARSPQAPSAAAPCYVAMMLGYGAPGVILPAAPDRAAGGTATIADAAAAATGGALRESATVEGGANNENTLELSLQEILNVYSLPTGTYDVWVRVRLDAAATASLRLRYRLPIGSNVDQPVVTTTSQTYAWLKLPGTFAWDRTNNGAAIGTTAILSIRAWRSAGAAGNVLMDRFAVLPRERNPGNGENFSAMDGSQDRAAELIFAAQAVPTMVGR